MQLTLEQRKLELRRSNYMRIFFNQIHSQCSISLGFIHIHGFNQPQIEYYIFHIHLGTNCKNCEVPFYITDLNIFRFCYLCRSATNHWQIPKDIQYFSDYRTHFFPQIWEENGGASYSPNVAYQAHCGDRGWQWSGVFFSHFPPLKLRCIL